MSAAPSSGGNERIWLASEARSDAGNSRAGRACVVFKAGLRELGGCRIVAFPHRAGYSPSRCQMVEVGPAC